jgi:hypothetical protein
MMRNSVNALATRTVAVAALCALSAMPLIAEDGFGFDSAGDSGSASVSLPVGAKIGGSLTAGATRILSATDTEKEIRAAMLGSLVSGKIDIDATGANADAHVGLGLSVPADAATSPFALREAYLRAYFGSLDLEGGLRKLTWGKADSQGPLDVVNPLDLSDLTVTDSLDRKIARPMLHASYGIGEFTKLEGVFVPSFVGHKIAESGPWVPYQVKAMPGKIAEAGVEFGKTVAASIPLPPGVSPIFKWSQDPMPSTSTLENWQGGARVTTTIASNDIGFQYYYGLLPRPAAAIESVTELPSMANPAVVPSLTITVKPTYNRYQQVGADWAAVIAGFNARAELAANITEDLAGTDAAVYNPSVLWSLGFDRTLVSDVTLNLQGAGSVRLKQDEVSKSKFDIENGKKLTHTTVTGVLSRKFLRDELEAKCTGLWGIEDADWLVMPALVWTKGDVSTELCAGFFGGASEGELGEYANNSWAKLAITCSF